MKRKPILSAHRGGPLVLALLLGGCAAPGAGTPPPVPPRPGFEERSLADEGLRRFLAANLGAVPTVWDFEALSWVAFHYHPSLELARAQWSTLQAARRSAAARVNPTLTVTPGFDSSRQSGISPWFPAVNLDFLLPASSKRRHQQDIARADAEAARLAVVAMAWTVRVELRAALNEAAAAARRESALRAQVAVQRELLELQAARQAAGLSSAGDVAPARIALLRLETAAAEAASQQSVARARVAAALGVPRPALDAVPLPPPAAAGKLSVEALAQARRESLRSRADVLAALARLESAESALALETARRFPDLRVGPGYQYDQGQNKWSVALSLELPVFNRNEGPIAEAVARRAEAAAHLIGVQAQAIAAIDAAVAAQEAAAGQLGRVRRVRDETIRQDALVRQSLALGAADQLEHGTARLELVQAEAAVAEAEALSVQAWASLADALQLPFPRIEALGEPARLQDFKAP